MPKKWYPCLPTEKWEISTLEKWKLQEKNGKRVKVDYWKNNCKNEYSGTFHSEWCVPYVFQITFLVFFSEQMVSIPDN